MAGDILYCTRNSLCKFELIPVSDPAKNKIGVYPAIRFFYPRVGKMAIAAFNSKRSILQEEIMHAKGGQIGRAHV